MPTPQLQAPLPFSPLNAAGFADPESLSTLHGIEGLRAEINATLDALIDGDYTDNAGLVEREMRLCSELGRQASAHSAAPEFRQAVGLLKILRATARFQEAHRSLAAS